MEIGRQSSDEVQAYATQRCLQADPASYSVVAEMMNAAEPRWGGSEEAMRTVAAYANARVDQNPLLALFAFEHAYYAISRMDDGDDQAIAVLAPAALQVPNAAYLRAVGGAYVRKRDYWKALVYLSQALRFMPDYAQESRYRAVTLLQLDQAEWARADAERAVALDPENGQNLRVLGDALRWSEGPVAALPYYKRALEDSATREDAFNDYCGALIDARRPDEARQCVDDLLAGYPDNPEGWRQRLVVIGYDAPGSKEAMERFLALNDPERWSLHAKYAEMVRKILAEKNGTASPSDAFDARVLRARALERSPGGRAYVQRLVAQPKNILETAFNACQATRKPGVPMEFTAVMSARPDGTLADVAVQPVNAWSSCFAKQLDAHKVPAPPQGAWGADYPLFYELKMR
jgi:tetratricopeptide (TPR) repeat protein